MSSSHRWILALMRHAKSDWAEAGLPDHERPLNDRGRRDAPKMARWLEHHGAAPDVILASTAKRVSETVQRMLKQWQHSPLVLSSSGLYLASPQTILEYIRNEAVDAQGRRPQRLLVVGHNPGMEQLVSSLAGAVTTMPTAAVALFECQAIRADDESAPHVERLISVARPKELS
ncbi:MAG: SixA phosphatase family protein [Planctomycetaceae bacterium]